MVKTELGDIKGIGEKTANELLRHFKSVKRIREADLPEIEAIIGKSKARLVADFFKTKETGQA